jgi:hypothetical protein
VFTPWEDIITVSNDTNTLQNTIYVYSFTASPLLLQEFTIISPSSLNNALASSYMVDIAVSGQQIFLLQSQVWYQFTLNQASGTVINVVQHTLDNPATSLAVVENGYYSNLVITQTEQILELFVNN